MSHSRVPKAGRRSGLTQQGGTTGGGGDEAFGGNNTRPRHSRGGDDADGSGDAPPRRQATGWGSPGEGSSKDNSEQAFGQSSTGGGHGRPRAGRRAGGGMSGAGGAGAGSGGWTTASDNNNNTATMSAMDEPRNKPSRNRHFDDNDDGVIQIIPDLESEEEEDLTKQVAVAPRNANRRVQTLRELDNDIKYTVPSATSGGIDLSLLTAALSPSDSLQESDKHWEFDTLLQQVAQAMQADKDKLEAMDDTDGPTSTQ